MRASLEHEEVEVVAVNDPFIDLEYMVSVQYWTILRVVKHMQYEIVYFQCYIMQLFSLQISHRYCGFSKEQLLLFLKLFQSFALTSILS